MSGGGSAPETPDYNTLARIQGVLDQDAARQQTQANRVNQINPYQSLTWENTPTEQRVFDADAYAAAMDAYSKQQKNPLANMSYTQVMRSVDNGLGGGGTVISNPNVYQQLDAPNKDDFYTNQMVDNWTQRTTLRPELEQALDTQMGAVPGMMQNAVDRLSIPFSLDGLSQVQGLDFSGLGDMPDSGFGAVQDIQDAMMGRLNPSLEQGRDREVQRLKAQGITEGTPAWQAAMQSLNQRDVDANQQALLGAMGASSTLFNQGLATRQQGVNELLQSRGASIDDRQRELQELLLQRSQPLTELSQLLSNGQIGSPGFEGYTQATPWQAPDVMGASQSAMQAAMGKHNADTASSSAETAGLLGLIGTIGAAFISDPRLKTDIEQRGIDQHTGLKLYEFSYIWDTARRYIGIMADEVRRKFPTAVGYINGYMFVDYGKLGLTMREV